jgi:hypothetical protein
VGRLWAAGRGLSGLLLSSTAGYRVGRGLVGGIGVGIAIGAFWWLGWVNWRLGWHSSIAVFNPTTYIRVAEP